jgi:hypothetical protein
MTPKREPAAFARQNRNVCASPSGRSQRKIR